MISNDTKLKHSHIQSRTDFLNGPSSSKNIDAVYSLAACILDRPDSDSGICFKNKIPSLSSRNIQHFVDLEIIKRNRSITILFGDILYINAKRSQAMAYIASNIFLECNLFDELLLLLEGKEDHFMFLDTFNGSHHDAFKNFQEAFGLFVLTQILKKGTWEQGYRFIKLIPYGFEKKYLFLATALHCEKSHPDRTDYFFKMALLNKCTFAPNPCQPRMDALYRHFQTLQSQLQERIYQREIRKLLFMPVSFDDPSKAFLINSPSQS